MHCVHCRLLRVTLDVATETGQGPRMESVEMCDCPRGYAGISCEVDRYVCSVLMMILDPSTDYEFVLYIFNFYVLSLYFTLYMRRLIHLVRISNSVHSVFMCCY